MNVTHKILSTGYHHVRAVGYAHLFAQWPIGEPLKAEHVSYNGDVDIPMFTSFIDAAQRAADTVEAEMREQRAADLRAHQAKARP